MPVLSTLEDLYENNIKSKHEPRFVALVARFKQIFGVLPQYLCRAPGRVNIIGEHIDYCGYSVLPAALEQDFIMAYIESDEDEIEIHNMENEKFPVEKIPTDPFQKFKEGHHWVNYFICGYKAVLAMEEKYYSQVPKPKGFKLLIDSEVPPAAGVSSSSAFTVCSSIVTLHANGMTGKIPKGDLSKMCVTSERSAGTACGGMDQTISIFAEMGKAKLIEFNPELRAIDVKVPSNVSLVIANSLTPSPKLLTLGTRYNKRVVECRFGLLLFLLKLKKMQSLKEKLPCKNFYELQAALGYYFPQMLELSSKHLKKGGYTHDDLKQEFGIEDLGEVLQDIPHMDVVLKQNTTFMVYERAYHVFGEAARVYEFKSVCDNADLDDEAKVQKLGQLMNESHYSCRDLYECSSEQLDVLTALAR